MATSGSDNKPKTPPPSKRPISELLNEVKPVTAKKGAGSAKPVVARKRR
jgi:hypothetical protein